MGLFRPRRPRSVERHVLVARSAAADAFALAHEHTVGGDDLDRDVSLECLGAAMRCLSALLWALHPEMDELSRADRESAIGDLIRRAPSQSPRRTRHPTSDVVHLMERAIDRVERVRAEAMRSDNPRVRTFAELDACVWHLATVLHIVDRDAYAKLLADRPVVRGQLALAEHLMEVAIAEQRLAAQKRRGG